MTPESILKRSICEYLSRFPGQFTFTLTPGITAGKKRQRSKFMPNGWPDITGVWLRSVRVTDTTWQERPIPFFIETKVAPAKLTQEQSEFLFKMNEWGCVALCAYSLQDVVEKFHGREANS